MKKPLAGKNARRLPKKAKKAKKKPKPKLKKAPGKPRGVTHRTDWEHNNQTIRDAFLDFVQKSHVGRQPTYEQLAKLTGLSSTTIKKHIQSIVFEPQKSKLRVFTPDVELAMLRQARAGSSRHIALWYQVMEGWAPKRDITSKGKVIKGMVAGTGTDEGTAFDSYMSELHDDKL